MDVHNIVITKVIDLNDCSTEIFNEVFPGSNMVSKVVMTYFPLNNSY